MASSPDSYEIRTEPRGPHWVGWVVRPGSDQPDRSIILVAKTQKEAEARARGWIGSIYNSQFTIHKEE